MRTPRSRSTLLARSRLLLYAVGGRCSVVRAGGTSRGHARGPGGRDPVDVGAEARVDRAARGSAHPSRAQSAGAAGPSGRPRPGSRRVLGAAGARRSAGADARQGSARASPGRAGGGARRPVRGVAATWRSGSRTRSPRCGRWPPSRWASSATPPRAARCCEALSGADPDPAGPRGGGAGSHRRQDGRAGRRRHGARARGGRRAAADCRRTHWTIRCRRRSKPRAWGSSRWPAWAATTRWRRRWWTNAALRCRAWWPVAYALQRVGDARAAPALTYASDARDATPTSFAIRGLAAAKDTTVIPQLRALVQERKADRAVVIQAIRALAALGDAGALPLLSRHDDRRVAGRGRAQRERDGIRHAGRSPRSEEALIDLLFDRLPARARASHAGAGARGAGDLHGHAVGPRRRPGLDRARGPGDGARRLARRPPACRVCTLMLEDGDNRVLPAVMAALVAAKAPDAEGAAARAADRAGLRGARGRRPGAGRAEGRGLARGAARGLSGRRAPSRPTRARGAILAAIHRIDPAAAKPLLEAALADRDWAMRVRAADLLKEGGTTTGIAERMRPATPGAAGGRSRVARDGGARRSRRTPSSRPRRAPSRSSWRCSTRR